MTADRLDAMLGDPWAADNPAGVDALLRADEDAVPPAGAERVLDAYGLHAEFVPAALGGRLRRVDDLVQVMRTVWRRDPTLGAGYGASSLIATVAVWCAGSPEQQRAAADLLLANGRVAAAYHELAHGNDLARAELAARRDGDHWLLSGGKEVVANLERAQAVLAFARTGDGPGSRSHGQFLLFKSDLPDGALRYLPPHRSAGMRGVQLGAARFVDCPAPAGAVLGGPGQGLENVLRAFQFTRATLPGMCVGVLDTGLRIALRYAGRRRLYGGTVSDLPHARALLARAFADLQAADAFSRVVTRSLQLLPEETAVSASAVKYLVPRLLTDAMDGLGTVLGAQSYLREGPNALFQKLSRDLAPAGFTHASRGACQVTVLPQLPRLARRAWFTEPPAAGAAMLAAGDLPVLDFGRFRTGAARSDSLAAVLVEAAEQPGPGGSARRLVTRFRDELAALREDCAALHPRDTTIDAPPAAMALVTRYTLVLAAAGCVAVHAAALANTAGQASTGPAEADEGWLCAVLDRLAVRLPGGSVLTEPERHAVQEAMLAIALDRVRDSRLLDLTARRVPG